MRGAKGYEAQTSARIDSIEENINKSTIWGIPMEWVAEDEEILKEIGKEKLGGDKIPKF